MKVQGSGFKNFENGRNHRMFVCLWWWCARVTVCSCKSEGRRAGSVLLSRCTGWDLGHKWKVALSLEPRWFHVIKKESRVCGHRCQWTDITYHIKSKFECSEESVLLPSIAPDNDQLKRTRHST